MRSVILNGEVLNPGDLDWEPFERLSPGIEIYASTSTKEETIARINGMEAVIGPGGVRLDESVLSHSPSVRYIGTLSTGYDMIDLEYCRKRGITVCNVPSYGTEMVSEYAIALLLEICCQIGHHSSRVKEGEWEKSGKRMFWDRRIIELKDKTMGIIGFGRIGKCTSRIAQAFGMKVLYNDSHRSIEEESERCSFSLLDDLFALSDVIMLHCPLLPETRRIISLESIGKMKDGVIIVNNARGPLVDPDALASALKSGKVYAAALDVTDPEPLPSSSPLMELDNCFITPHISWVARESRRRLMEIAAANLKGYMEGNVQNEAKAGNQ